MEKMSDLVEKRVDVSCLRFVLLFLIKLELKETSKKYVLIIYLNFFFYMSSEWERKKGTLISKQENKSVLTEGVC